MDLSNLIAVVLYVFILFITVFIVSYAALQIRNYNDIVTTEYTPTTKTTLIKWIVISSLSILLCMFIYQQTFNNLHDKTPKPNAEFKKTLASLQQTLIFAISLNETHDYETIDDLATSIIRKYPVHSVYNLETDYLPNLTFEDLEIVKYNLYDYEHQPTFARFEMILISIIKFKEGCRYVDLENLENSDCVIEADANHFKEPNKRGIDRTIYAIDGEYNTIKADENFFQD